jgi:hypothetical protein
VVDFFSRAKPYRKKPEFILAFRVDEDSLVSTPIGKIKVKQGYYVIQTSRGDFITCPSEKFEELYESF